MIMDGFYTTKGLESHFYELFLCRMEPSSFRPSRDFERLKREEARLESFSFPPGWSLPFVTPEDCARAGFFFLQDGDKVNINVMWLKYMI